MFSHTSEYALRAAAYIATHSGGGPLVAKRVAAGACIPRMYAQQVLRTLVCGGVLVSGRGVGGGFQLKRPADQICLLDVMLPFEPVLQASACPFGEPRCSDAGFCPLKEHLGLLVVGWRQLLKQTTLADLVARHQGLM